MMADGEGHTAAVMGFLDIIEMVCDWRGAYLGYGSQGTWAENIERQRERYAQWFSAGQWWLIEQVAQVAALLGPTDSPAIKEDAP
jgi:hypothetical protein